ncbi:MAG: hypothetical protein AAFN70_15835, partial [Planctomycetota bacterium]
MLDDKHQDQSDDASADEIRSDALPSADDHGPSADANDRPANDRPANDRPANADDHAWGSNIDAVSDAAEKISENLRRGANPDLDGVAEQHP